MGAPVVRNRAASLSVAKSPTTTAVRKRPFNSNSVFCNNVVFPAPGEETMFNVNKFKALNVPRFCSAKRSFPLKMPVSNFKI